MEIALIFIGKKKSLKFFPVSISMFYYLVHLVLINQIQNKYYYLLFYQSNTQPGEGQGSSGDNGEWREQLGFPLEMNIQFAHKATFYNIYLVQFS